MREINVYFQNSENKERIIGIAHNIDDVMKIIKDFIDDHNFKSYYTRVWYHENDDRTWFDVGSHTEFFFVVGNIYEDMVEYNEEQKEEKEKEEKDKQSRYATYYRPE